MEGGEIVECGPPHQILPKISGDVSFEEPKGPVTPPSE